MLNANFDALNRSAAVIGAYQYDTGQRLYMHGLPSPDEMAEADEFLSGEIATIQVHFGMRGDSQTEARLAQWDEDRGCWITAVPDSYLQTAEDVYAYVYVSHGQDEAGNGRTKTMYELVFRPISRPAPNNVATNEQWEAWALKKEEIDLALDALNSAASGLDAAGSLAESSIPEANKAKIAANGAAADAEESLARLNAIEKFWDGITVQKVDLPAESSAYVKINGNVLTYGIPQGAKGEAGNAGNADYTDISLSMSDGILTITPKG